MHELKGRSNRVLILAYHGINNNKAVISVRPEIFERQLALLKKRHFQNLSLKEYICGRKANHVYTKKHVIITFDDGWQDNYVSAFPVLQKYGYTATIFLTASYIGRKRDYLTWDQVSEMRKSGLEFGSHTLTHPDLTKIPLEKAWQEIAESKRSLENKLNEEIKVFCYPYGEYNQDVIKLVKKAGYQGAVVTPHSGKCERSFYTIQRIGLYSKDTMLSFRIKTSRLREVIASNEVLWATAKRLKKWLRV